MDLGPGAQLAQIECWDIGIATYRLHYDWQNGLADICSAGEISSVINQIKYQKLIKKFHEKKYRHVSTVTDKMC